jgi:NitT/TauT family transport system substrate-binding protein
MIILCKLQITKNIFFLNIVIFVHRLRVLSDWIAENPEVLNHFLKSLAQAEAFTNNNPDQAKTIVKNQMNYTDGYMGTVWSENQFSLSLDQSLVSTMEAEARWMINNNLTNKTIIPDFLNYINVDGLYSVKPESVNLIR